MIEEAGAHLRNMDDSLIKQQHMSERCLNELEEKLIAKQEVRRKTETNPATSRCAVFDVRCLRLVV